MTPPPPQESPFAAVIGLGALKQEFKRGSKWFDIGCGVVLLLGGLLLCPVMLFFKATDPSLEWSSFFIITGLIVAVGLGGAWWLFDTWRNWKLAAALYDKGFALQNQQGVHTIPWTDVKYVWQAITKHYRNGIYTGTTHIYTIVTNTDQKFVLNDQLKKVEELGSAIQQNVSEVLWPQYVQALQNNQRLTFGPLALDAKGLYSGNKALTWEEIKAIKIHQGTISVKKEKGWFSWATVTVPQIPNFLIFWNLVSRFAKTE